MLRSAKDQCMKGGLLRLIYFEMGWDIIHIFVLDSLFFSCEAFHPLFMLFFLWRRVYYRGHSFKNKINWVYLVQFWQQCFNWSSHQPEKDAVKKKLFDVRLGNCSTPPPKVLRFWRFTKMQLTLTSRRTVRFRQSEKAGIGHRSPWSFWDYSNFGIIQSKHCIWNEVRLQTNGHDIRAAGVEQVWWNTPMKRTQTHC